VERYGQDKTEKLGENMSHCHFMYRKFQMDDTGAYPGLRNVKPAVNPLKPSGNYIYHLLYQSVIVPFVFMGLA
jgi:hypothetical protein